MPAAAALMGASFLLGCADGPTPSHAKATPPPMKSLYAAPADKVLTSTLLDFDGPYDSTFVDALSVLLAGDPSRAGNRTLAAQGRVKLNLASLIRGRDFGGAWDMIGVKVWCESAVTCDVALAIDGSSGTPTHRAVPPRSWTTIWLPVTPAASAHPSSTQGASTFPATSDSVQLSVTAGSPVRFLVDDVALGQSRVTACETRVPKTGEAWTVKRIGPSWRAAIDGRTFYELPAAPFVPGGYRSIESGPTRVVFTNDAGSTIALDRTGRLIENGVAKLDPGVLKIAKAIAECASPASIEIVNEEGRIERTLPGDHDNDGFDETRGCYTVHAISGRATVRFTHQRSTVKWPVLEVLDLPAGAISVWVAGETVPWAVRGNDGRAIVELPIELESPVEVQVRVK